MKNLILAMVIAASAFPVHAQLFSGEALNGALLGGLIGGIVGHNSGRHTAEGVGIGAGAGLLLGTLANQSRAVAYGEAQPGAPFAPAYIQRPNYAAEGAILGGIAGGVIGHNSGGRTAEGIAIGAASGLFLGAVADQSGRRQLQAQSVPVAYAVQSAPAQAAPGASSTPPQPATRPVNNTSYTATPSSMAGANSLFGR